MTPKSPLSPHFRSDTYTATRLRFIPDCSAQKGLQSYNNNILNCIVVERRTCIIKLVLTMISNLNSFFYFETKNSKLLICISIFLYYVYTESLAVQQTATIFLIVASIIFSSDYSETVILNCPEGNKCIIVVSFNIKHFFA